MIGHVVSRKNRRQGGFTLIELIAVMIIIIILAGVVIWSVLKVPSSAGPVAYEADVTRIQEAVAVFYQWSDIEIPGPGIWPTESGDLPPEGETYDIYWYQSFSTGGDDTVAFYPDVIQSLPRHWSEEGVWVIDSDNLVLCNWDPEQY